MRAQAVRSSVGRFAVFFAAAFICIAAFAAKAEAAFSDYGIASVGISLSDTRAGAHPDITTAIALKVNPSTNEAFALTRDLTIKLPPGFTGNPNAVPQCDARQLTTPISADIPFGLCPQASQVGVTVVSLGIGAAPFVEPIYNMEPPGGSAVARLGFIAGQYPTFLNLTVRSGGDYGVTAAVTGAAAKAQLRGAVTTIWGVPADPSHDTLRLTPVEARTKTESPPRSSGLAPAPFTSNPTHCGDSGSLEVSAVSYQLPEQISTVSTPFPEIDGCESLAFEPTLTLTSTSDVAAGPTGLDAELRLRQDESPYGIATSHMRGASIVLPPGMTLSTGAADGLEACSAEQVGFEEEPAQAANCPAAAKIGSVTIAAPALSEPLQGAIYQRSPEPGNLFRVWLVADGLGVHLKIPGEVHADPTTGQLTVTFSDTPQFPVKAVQMHVRGGPRAPLVNPSKCGEHRAGFEFTPWSRNPSVLGGVPIRVDEGCGTGGFAPRLKAGTVNPFAGSHSPFVLKVTREDGEQNIARIDVRLPPGVLAKLAGVPLCVPVGARIGDCPAASQIGVTTVAVGPGSNPLWVPQPGKDPTAVFLAGPYKGAPYSLVVKVPAQAGPFDFGNVVVRAAIHVDPKTARATVRSDPLPQILEGVPISYRTIYVDVNRPDFTLNPTSCDRFSVNSEIASDRGATVVADDEFQATDCAKLGFKPRIFTRLVGGTKRNQYPALRAVLRARPGDANIARAAVTLPHSEFLANEHIETVCTRAQFADDACPAGSIYGRAKAITPLLDKPLTGQVYLRSSNNLLPDLVAALRGQVDIDLVGRIDSVNGGIRTTFAAVPDAPVTKFTLTMKGGEKGLLVNSRNLCARPSFSVVKLDGQNGKLADRRPLMSNSCAGKDR